MSSPSPRTTDFLNVKIFPSNVFQNDSSPVNSPMDSITFRYTCRVSCPLSSTFPGLYPHTDRTRSFPEYLETSRGRVWSRFHVPSSGPTGTSGSTGSTPVLTRRTSDVQSSHSSPPRRTSMSTSSTSRPDHYPSPVLASDDSSTSLGSIHPTRPVSKDDTLEPLYGRERPEDKPGIVWLTEQTEKVVLVHVQTRVTEYRH